MIFQYNFAYIYELCVISGWRSHKLKRANTASNKYYRGIEIIRTLEKIFKITYMYNIGNVISKTITEMERQSDNDINYNRFISSGFTSFDRITGGFERSTLTVFGSRPSIGKSSLMLSMIKNIALSDIPICFFTLESTNTQIVKHLIVQLIPEIPLNKIRYANLEPHEWMLLELKFKKLCNAKLILHDSVKYFDSLCSTISKLATEKDIHIFFIDYLQLISFESYSESRYSEINYMSRTLKSIAKELDISIVISSQLNRNPEKKTLFQDKKPFLWDLRDSGTICDDADVVCLIHRPEFYGIFEDEEGRSLINRAELLVEKNRRGNTGECTLGFKAGCFYEIDGHFANDEPISTGPL